MAIEQKACIYLNEEKLNDFIRKTNCDPELHEYLLEARKNVFRY